MQLKETAFHYELETIQLNTSHEKKTPLYMIMVLRYYMINNWIYWPRSQCIYKALICPVIHKWTSDH